MIKSFKIMATMMMAGVATAGSVDIGLGRMDQAEFIALKAMIQGRQTDYVSVMSTPRDTAW